MATGHAMLPGKAEHNQGLGTCKGGSGSSASFGLKAVTLLLDLNKLKPMISVTDCAQH